MLLYVLRLIELNWFRNQQQQQRHDQRPARLSTKSNCTNNNPEAVTSGLVDGGENRVLIGPARKIESVVPGTVLV